MYAVEDFKDIKKERETQKMNEARRRRPFTRNNNGCLVELLSTGSRKKENKGTHQRMRIHALVFINVFLSVIPNLKTCMTNSILLSIKEICIAFSRKHAFSF
jgi:hypothetical protein